MTKDEGQSLVTLERPLSEDNLEQNEHSSRVDSVNLAGDSGFSVEIGVQGLLSKFIIDTGATVTLLNYAQFMKIPMSSRPSLKPVKFSISMADGTSPLYVHGSGVFSLKCGSSKVKHEIVVANVIGEGLLGMDFISKHVSEINLRDKFLVIGTSVVQMSAEFGRTQNCSLISTSTINIPPRHEVIIPTSIEGKLAPQCRTAIVEPNETLIERNGVLVARALVDVTNATIPVKLCNLQEEEMVIYKHMKIGRLEYVDSVSPFEDTESLNGRKVCQTVTNPDKSVHPVQGLHPVLREMVDKSRDNITSEQVDQYADMLQRRQDAFSLNGELGRTNIVEHRINTGDAVPIRQRLRRLPESQCEEASNQIREMLKKDIIEPSNSPWSSPIVLVKKKDSTYRFCVDYRKLNAVTVKDAYPLPRIDSMLDSLSGSSLYSTLDLATGYWQVQMDKEHKEKTAFITRDGLFQFKVLPFGVANGPACFERLMETVLAGLQWKFCLVYLDDIIVYGATFEEHLMRLELVLQRLIDSGLKLKPKKCTLFQKQVEFLGYVISPAGVATDTRKIEAVEKWPVPQNVTEIKTFLGLCSYYRRFVKNFSKIAAPLYQLTQKDQIFNWTSNCQDTFNQMKNCLTEAPILAYPDFGKEFILDTDASRLGIGGILSQVQDGEERVIAYASRAMNKHEQKYCVTRQELLAAVYFIKYFKNYLYGRPFTLRVDHAAIQWIRNFKEPEGQVARWLEILGTYDFKIQHRPGLKHGNADALSRRPCSQCGWQDYPEEVVQSACTVNVMESQKDVIIEGHSREEYRMLQLEDPSIGQILKLKETKLKQPSWEEVSIENAEVKAYWARWEQLVILNGVLYMKWLEMPDEVISYRIVVPTKLRTEVCQQMHDSKTAGHLGQARTVEKIKTRFYWYKMSQDIKSYCNTCFACASRKSVNKKRRAPLQQYVVGVPMERVALDILGPLPRTRKGNVYILVISEYFTKWVECYAMRRIDAKTTAALFVEQFVCRFGLPRQVHTDQGSNFTSKLFHEVCSLLQMDKTRTTGYCPHSDGLVERFNRTLEEMLSLFVSECQKNWDEYLPYLMLAYRTSKHSSTQVTPCKMMFGRDVTLPVDLVEPIPEKYKVDRIEPCQYVKELEGKLSVVHEFARQKLKCASEIQKYYYDMKSFGSRFKVGDVILLYHPLKKIGITPKLQCYWKGPYVVTKRINNVNYEIKQSPTGTPQIVHFNRMRPFKGECDSSWAMDSSKKIDKTTQT